MAKNFFKPLEKQVEARLVRKTKTILKGIAPKYSSPGRRSVPDRILLWLVGMLVFVECKRPGKTWTTAQARERDKLRALGHWVFLVSTYDEVDELIANLALL